ncbi:MAG: gamma-glutamyl-gamma-aminobutyrate hydrolase family protein [Nitratireductor sp.]
MKIAILLTDVDDSAFTHSFPNDGEKFARLMSPIRPNWHYTVYPVKDGIFPADISIYDAIVITGSPASVHDDLPWIPRLFDLIRAAHARKMPMIGACFGHQAIATALGGRVAKNTLGWGLGATTTTFVRHLDWMNPAHAELRLYCAHNEQVVELPEGAIVLGHDPIAPVSAFAIGDHILATQHHPEMTPDYVAGLLDYIADDIDPLVMAKARLSVENGADGEKFAAWMIDFIEAAVSSRELAETGHEGDLAAIAA